MDDRALVYRGADQPDMSIINPEADVWQHIKVYWSVASGMFVSNILEDSSKLSSSELAHPIFFIEQRWSLNCHCWPKRFDTLQLDFWAMEGLQ